MEKQLVDALKKANNLSDIDEVSRDMIMSRAKVVLQKAHSIMDRFADDFRELTENDAELCSLLGISCILAYTDDYCKMCANEEGNPDSAIKTTIVYGSNKETQLLHMQLMIKILKDDLKQEDTDDED